MNYTERIYDFLDGMLDAAEEAELLRLAADNADIRDELRQAMTLQSAFKADVRALTPPPALTQKIFSHVAAQTSIPAQASIPVQASIHTVSGATSNTPLTAIVSSLITAFLLLSWNGLSSNIAAKSNMTWNNKSVYAASNLALLRVPRIVRTAQAQTQTNEATQQKNTLKSLNASNGMALSGEFAKLPFVLQNAGSLVESSLDSGFSSKVREAFEETPHLAQHIDVTPPQTPVIATLAADSLFVKSPPLIVPESKNQGLSLSNVSIHARRIVSMSLPSIDFPSNPSSFLRNTAIAALYKLSEHHAVGIELSEETYLQRFRAQLSEGAPMLDVLQNPALLWCGVAYRYTMLPKEAFSPFVHGVVGGTELGANGRVMLGLTYSPDDRTQFLLGVESSALLYLHQNVLYASPKLGFSYGVSLRL